MGTLTLRADVHRRVESVYGVEVEYSNAFSDGMIADLDGKTIFLADGLDAERALFALLHLFGHCVQWNTSERSRELGVIIVSAPDRASLDELVEYEIEAHDLGLTLLIESGGDELTSWYAKASAADLQQLVEFYRGSAHEWLGKQQPPVIRPPVPKPIPMFLPTRWNQRLAGGRVMGFPV